MATLTISDQLFEHIQLHAISNGLTVDEWLEHQFLPEQPAREKLTTSSIADTSLIRKIGDAMPYMLYIFDLRHGHNVYVNQYTEEFFGRRLSEIQDHGLQLFADRVHPDDLHRLEEIEDFWRSIPDNTLVENEYRIRRADGEYRYFRSHEAVLERSDDGSPTQIVGTAIDITERKQAVLKLRESENRLQQAMHIAQLGIWEWDIATDITTWHGDMHRIYGVTPEDFTGKGSDYIEFTREDYREGQRANIAGAFEKGISEKQLRDGIPVAFDPKELCIVQPDGSEVFTIGDAVTIVDEHGNPKRMIGSTLDITKRKQAEQIEAERTALALKLEKEHEVAAQRSKMLAILSHELRTPLTIISSSNAILSKYRDKLTEEQRDEKFAKITEQIQQLDKLLDELSMISRINQSFLDCRPESVHIEAFCQDILRKMNGLTDELYLLELEITGQDESAMLDKKLMYHALTNVISNAIKYSPQGSQIRLFVKQIDDGWQFSIKDNGIGIPEDEQANLFVPFSRASNVGEIRGTGLGLSIVKEIVECHGGSVSVDSTLGRGSTFTLFIPTQLKASA